MTKCPNCDGDGWVLDVKLAHARNCACDTEGIGFTCPIHVEVQVKCRMCAGSGEVPEPEEARWRSTERNPS